MLQFNFFNRIFSHEQMLGGANIFLKHRIVVYSKNITASAMWAGDIFSVQIPGLQLPV
jgi:hypothetical protein